MKMTAKLYPSRNHYPLDQIGKQLIMSGYCRIADAKEKDFYKGCLISIYDLSSSKAKFTVGKILSFKDGEIIYKYEDSFGNWLITVAGKSTGARYLIKRIGWYA